MLRNRLQILREDNKVLSGASQAVEKVNVSELFSGHSISRKVIILMFYYLGVSFLADACLPSVICLCA